MAKGATKSAAATVGACVIALILFSIYALAQRPLGQSTYSQIRSAGVIRAAFVVGAPLLMVDPNTKEKTGLFYEVVNTAGSKLGLNVNWTEEVGYGQMIEGLNSKRYDIVGSGIWTNAGRGKDADFTIPIYYDAVFPYVREADTRFDKDISVLNGSAYTISVMDGELGETIARTDFPLAKIESLPQTADFTQMVLNVLNRRADVVFLSLAAARQYQEANPKKIKAIDPAKPIRVYPVAIILPKGAYELKQALDYAIVEMLNNGEIEPILKKYEKVPGSFLRVASPYSLPNRPQ